MNHGGETIYNDTGLIARKKSLHVHKNNKQTNKISEPSQARKGCCNGQHAVVLSACEKNRRDESANEEHYIRQKRHNYRNMHAALLRQVLSVRFASWSFRKPSPVLPQCHMVQSASPLHGRISSPPRRVTRLLERSVAAERAAHNSRRQNATPASNGNTLQRAAPK